MTITIKIVSEPGIAAALGKIQADLDSLRSLIEQEVKTMKEAIEALRAEVTEVKTIQESAVSLIKGLAEKIAANAGDATAVSALAAELHANAEALGEAVRANTEAPPTEAS